MDDVAAIIARTVADASDPILWDWDDVIRCAAVLSSIQHPFLKAIAKHLWMSVDETLGVQDRLYHVPRAMSDVSRIRTQKKDVLGLVRSAKCASVNARSNLTQLEAAVKQAGDRPVGPSCAISVKSARRALDLLHRWISLTNVRRTYGIHDAVLAEAMNAPRGGVMFRLIDVREQARAELSRRVPKVERAVVKARKRLEPTMQYIVELRRTEELRVATERARLPRALEKVDAASVFVREGGDLDQVLQCMREIAAQPEVRFALKSTPMWCTDLTTYFPTNMDAWKVDMAREMDLRHALEAKGLQARRDSSICRQYVSGLRFDINEVVEIMLEMDWFFKHTTYSSLVYQPRYGYRRNRYHDRYSDSEDWGYSSDDSYSSDNDPVERSFQAKIQALNARGSVPPDAPSRVLELAARHNISVC